MDCKEFREMLDLHVDRELSSEAELEARLHVQECARCRSVEQQLRLLRASLKRLVAENDPPPHLIRNVKRIWQPRWRKAFSTADRKTVNRFWKHRVELPAPVFGLFLLIVCGFAFLLVPRLTSRLPDTRGVSNERTRLEKTTGGSDSGLMDLTRFDHGGRISLYKSLASK